MLRYLSKEEFYNSEYKDSFKRKSELKRIKNIEEDPRQTSLILLMTDDNDDSFQGIAYIGMDIEDDIDLEKYWGVAAINVTEEYHKDFMRIIDENVSVYIDERANVD